MMKKLIFIALLISGVLFPGILNASSGYSISLMGVYGWNETWKSHGGVDVIGYFPINSHFEATASAECLSAGAFSTTLVARPKFILPVGEIFLDGSLHYRHFSRYRTADFDIAASAGYRMDYVSAQFGLISHTSLDYEYSSEVSSSGSRNVSEPFNLLYRVAFNVRPASSVWNAGCGVANFTDFEYERTWEPMFFLHGSYNVSNRLSVLFRGDLKPSGAFHLNAHFWGIAARAGIKYTF